MDMFMDKLAQKLTAQEIIKANTAADVEELNKLKNQIAEYNECLERLQRLIDDGFGKLSDIRTNEGEMARIVEESSERTKALGREAAELCRFLEQLSEKLEGLEGTAAKRIEILSESMAEQTQTLSESVTGQVASLTVSVGEKIDQLCGQLEAQSGGGISERLDILEENVHKECVKVYRNVQAVTVEESGKQSEALNETKAGMAAMKGKLGKVLGTSVAAMILSLAGVLIQILSGLNILPF